MLLTMSIQGYAAAIATPAFINSRNPTLAGFGLELKKQIPTPLLNPEQGYQLIGSFSWYRSIENAVLSTPQRLKLDVGAARFFSAQQDQKNTGLRGGLALMYSQEYLGPNLSPEHQAEIHISAGNEPNRLGLVTQTPNRFLHQVEIIRTFNFLTNKPQRTWTKLNWDFGVPVGSKHNVGTTLRMETWAKAQTFADYQQLRKAYSMGLWWMYIYESLAVKTTLATTSLHGPTQQAWLKSPSIFLSLNWN